jgi:hypothetical protein
MERFYVTLGKNHRHMLEDKIWDHQAVLELRAEDVSAAENYAFDQLGTSWAMMTNEEEHRPECYPKGKIGTITVR